MRNGFRSSRGAMRGIIGATVGFATVAIGFGPFVYAAFEEPVRLRLSSLCSFLDWARLQNSCARLQTPYVIVGARFSSSWGTKSASQCPGSFTHATHIFSRPP